MANSVMMYAALGYPADHPQRAIARQSIEKLLVVHDDEAYCQPCVSPIWDTGLACHALLEAGGERVAAEVKRGLDWLVPMQVLDVRGDWIARRPDVRPGGWAFQYANPHYPDVDDTAVVAMAMDRMQGRPQQGTEAADYRAAIERAREWIVGMQSENGGWGAFDADNEYYYLNNIPFADHGALLDPPTEDVTARCLSMLAQLGDTQSPAVTRAVDYLRKTQLADGSWYGRWGMNYIYGTWSVLCALNAAGVAARRAGNAQGGRLARRDPERGRRLGRGRRKLQARLQRLRESAVDRLADRLGAARPDGGRRGRPSGGRRAASNTSPTTRAPTVSGTRSATPPRVSRACSTCATTAMRSSSRSGRWRATAISRAAMRARGVGDVIVWLAPKMGAG